MSCNTIMKDQQEAWRAILRARGDLARFAILFRLIEALVFTPLSALAGHLLSGRTVVDSTDLAGFFLSPRGFAATFVSATLLVTIRLIEQAGLTAILLETTDGRRLTSSAALDIVSRLLPRVMAVAAWLLLAALAVVTPLCALAGFYANSLLSKHDINYYLAERPSEFVTAAAVLSVVALPTVATVVWLAVRWRLVAPVLLCERGSARESLLSSARLVHGHWLRMGTAWLTTELLILALGLLAAWTARLCSLSALLLAGEEGNLHWGFFAGLLVVRTVLTGIITLPGPCLAAG